jgi:2-keto-3-deoxy-6-phosphogluconate aldolase
MKFIPVGGISLDDIPAVIKLGVSAVGLGNSLFDASVSIDEFKKRISKITAQYS